MIWWYFFFSSFFLSVSCLKASSASLSIFRCQIAYQVIDYFREIYTHKVIQKFFEKNSLLFPSASCDRQHLSARHSFSVKEKSLKHQTLFLKLSWTQKNQLLFSIDLKCIMYIYETGKFSLLCKNFNIEIMTVLSLTTSKLLEAKQRIRLGNKTKRFNEHEIISQWKCQRKRWLKTSTQRSCSYLFQAFYDDIISQQPHDLTMSLLTIL